MAAHTTTGVVVTAAEFESAFCGSEVDRRRRVRCRKVERGAAARYLTRHAWQDITGAFLLAGLRGRTFRSNSVR